MATQYTGGLTTGQVLTAATMNSIGATWETWTPTVTPASGVFYVLTVNLARYGRIGKLVYGQIDFSLTSIGTGSGIAIFTLPVTATSTNFIAVGSYRETQNTGLSGIVDLESTTTGGLRRYDNASHLSANNRYGGFFVYEAA
jgi:hypothetical protein